MSKFAATSAQRVESEYSDSLQPVETESMDIRGGASTPGIWQSFIVGLCFYTRLPIGNLTTYTPQALNHSSRFLAVYGLIVGLATAAYTLIMLSFLPATVAVTLGMAASLLLTGAFHEDGLADCADGFGGGWATEQVLAIMKDSRLGTYGMVTLTLTLLMKWQVLVLASADPLLLTVVIVTGHTVSRGFLSSVLTTYEYVRADKLSKAKPIAEMVPSFTRTLNYVVMAAVVLPLMAEGGAILMVALYLISKICGQAVYFRLGGYTGDCLGAIQQLLEIVWCCMVLGISLS